MPLLRTFIPFTFAAFAATSFPGAAIALPGDMLDEHHDHYRDSKTERHGSSSGKSSSAVHLGPRPGYLVDGMDDGPLKRTLQQCMDREFHRTDFSIGHRGAPLQFPEHTEESYRAAARQGAGILECDVTFTKDKHLVCRHAECDLHTTTNIITSPLNRFCTTPWDPANPNPDSVRCCASDLSLDQFKSLTGKMDARDSDATTAEVYQRGTANWRTDLYAAPNRGKLMTHGESIRLFRELGAKYTPELKAGDAARLMEVFGGSTAKEAQRRYAQALVNEYIEAGAPPNEVWPQSFNLEDVLYWIEHTEYGGQAVYLDGRYADENFPGPDGDLSLYDPTMEEIAAKGINIIAPPMHFLLKVDDEGRIEPSKYAKAARRAGLEIIAWTFERSNLRNGSRTGPDTATFYYQFDLNPNIQVINKDSDMYKVLHVLAKRVKILGIFSDWPATVTYYANCMDL